MRRNLNSDEVKGGELGSKYVEDVMVVFKSYITRIDEDPFEDELSLEEIERLGLIERA
jgi:Adenylosuccinate synthetase (EC 6.3.4.4)